MLMRTLQCWRNMIHDIQIEKKMKKMKKMKKRISETGLVQHKYKLAIRTF